MSGYVSKDFVHYGCGLMLQPDFVLEQIPYSVKKNIKKAENAGIEVKRVDGSHDYIEILRSMWYDPDDPNLPNRIGDNEFMFIAYLDSVPVGAIILLGVDNHLFLNNLAGNKLGKKYRVQDYLLWYCVNFFADSDYKYIDVGVSYRPSLYKFFIKWQIAAYPVIFNKPEIGIRIPNKPFNNNLLLKSDKKAVNESIELIKKLTGVDQFTFVPHISNAQDIFALNNIDPNDQTYNFPKVNSEPSYIDLTDIFSVQFGAIIFNMDISDKDMWNQYQCLDVFKRELVYTMIRDELDDFDIIVDRRMHNHDFLQNMFELDDIFAIRLKNLIPSTFSFIYNQNHRFHAKLNEFEIQHYYNDETGEIGLPIHHNLSESQLEYMYGIFRGVLNLCSDWDHTDKYDKFKS